VAQGMVFSDTPLGIIPGGTGNDFVKALGIPCRLERDRVSYARTERTAMLTIQSAGPVPVHVDGEIFPESETVYELSVVPRSLNVISA
jgi:diacylglycerol kinase family enzyme